MDDLKWDIFISHASEDKESVAVPLADGLRSAGALVWLDAHELKIGDSLSAKIDEGLALSRFGAVVISPAFLSKFWPKKEFSGLRAKEEAGGKVLLPIWHGVDRADVLRFSPTLADALAANTAQGIPAVTASILDVIFDPQNNSPYTTNPPLWVRLQTLLESSPSTAAVAEFLRANASRAKDYSDTRWGPCTIGSIEFQGYWTYIGHGAALTVSLLSEAWGDPFDVAPPTLSAPLRKALSDADTVIERFESDLDVQKQVSERIFRSGQPFGIPPDAIQRMRQQKPQFRLQVFAGRRKYIDADAQRHEEWARLREQPQRQLTSYDALIDDFRKARND